MGLGGLVVGLETGWVVFRFEMEGRTDVDDAGYAVAEGRRQPTGQHPWWSK
jgi:hypothetical protein